MGGLRQLLLLTLALLDSALVVTAQKFVTANTTAGIVRGREEELYRVVKVVAVYVIKSFTLT